MPKKCVEFKVFVDADWSQLVRALAADRGKSCQEIVQEFTLVGLMVLIHRETREDFYASMGGPHRSPRPTAN